MHHNISMTVNYEMGYEFTMGTLIL